MPWEVCAEGIASSDTSTEGAADCVLHTLHIRIKSCRLIPLVDDRQVNSYKAASHSDEHTDKKVM